MIYMNYVFQQVIERSKWLKRDFNNGGITVTHAVKTHYFVSMKDIVL